jgi:endonuclease-3 related protein
MNERGALLSIYDRLLDRYGPQGWWPAETRVEVMVGAVLTQAAAWTNVEMAIAGLKAAGALSPGEIRALDVGDLARLIYSSGYYNAKARKLKALMEYLARRFDDDLDAMAAADLDTLRSELLDVHGIGEETADDILLYALGKPVFVVDAYTRRLFFRLGLTDENGTYSSLTDLFVCGLPTDPELFGEYHALIVVHSTDICKKLPLCQNCCLLDTCPTGQMLVRAQPMLPEAAGS